MAMVSIRIECNYIHRGVHTVKVGFNVLSLWGFRDLRVMVLGWLVELYGWG